MAPLLAQAIQSIHEDGSVSTLYLVMNGADSGEHGMRRKDITITAEPRGCARKE